MVIFRAWVCDGHRGVVAWRCNFSGLGGIAMRLFVADGRVKERACIIQHTFLAHLKRPNSPVHGKN